VKIIIAGGRSFDDYDLLCRKADVYLSRQDEVEIVSGTAKGADKLGEKYATERGYPIKRFPADWGTHGNKAGYLRNEDMAIYADTLIAFWDEQSKGTKHMIDIAELHGLKIRIVRYSVTN
jgi:hypothetical protein